MLKRIISSFALAIVMIGKLMAGSGLLFNVVSTGTPANLNITLCLNGLAPLSCQTYLVSGLDLTIRTTIPNRLHPVAGIKVNTPGYALNKLGIDCVSINNGYCLFSVSNTQATTILLERQGTLNITPTTLPNGVLNSVYNQTITASGGVAPYHYVITAGSLPTGLSLNATTGVLSGTPTSNATYNFRLTVTDSANDSSAQDYSITVTGSLALNPPTLPAGTLSTAYSQTITANGGIGPYTYAVTSGALPTGLTLSGGGVLSGTPTSDNTYNFTITATDSNSSDTGSQAYSVVISGALTLSPSSLPAGTLSTAYSQTITASGGVGPYTYAVTSGALPTGLTLSGGGVLSGTPTSDNTYNFTITATDSNSSDTGSQAYSVVISGSLTVNPSSLPAGTSGTAYSQTITASGGVGPYTYVVTSGTLPTGLNLSSGGVLSGTPSSANTYTFTVTATDSNSSDTGSRGYSVTISAPAYPTLTSVTASSVEPIVYTGTNLSAFQGSPYDFYAATVTGPSQCTDAYLVENQQSNLVDGSFESNSGDTTITSATPFPLSEYVESFAGQSFPACIALCLTLSGPPYAGQSADCTNALYVAS